VSTNNCPACGAPVGPRVTECRYCGEAISVSQPQSSTSFVQTTTSTSNAAVDANEILESVSSALRSANNINNVNNINNINNINNMNPVYISTKSKTAAGILAILLGGLGIHKFYLGRVGWGIVYILFCWTYIPSIIAIIEGVVYLTSSEQSFNMKYGKVRNSL
jgi:TM2 domain-containing membrane protein YozV